MMTIVSITCWQVDCCWGTELWTAGDNALYAVSWPHLIGWGPPTYYNSCYTIEGCGHLYYKIYKKIETIKPGPKGDHTDVVLKLD